MAEPEEDRDAQGPDPEEVTAKAEPAEPAGPVDEDAVWAELIAAYDADPGPGEDPWPEAEGLGGRTPAGPADPPQEATHSIVVRPAAPGPRDYELDEVSDDAPGAAAGEDPEDDAEEHFVPPEPPPLPEADVTTKFAWLALLGGPLLVLAFVLLQQDLPWWAAVVGVGGFLGGFVTLVTRMRPGGDEDDDLPGSGAVV